MRRDSGAGENAGQDLSFEARWRRRFQERARHFDDDAAIAGWSRSGLDGRFRRFRDVWEPPQRAGSWLDAGCGAGTYTRFLEAHGLKVLGTDYSLPSLQRARSRADARLGWCVADVRHLPVPSRSMDGVICLGVMQSLAEPDSALREIARCVSSDGQVWVDGLNQWCLPNLIKESIRRLRRRSAHLRYDAPGDLRARLRAAGMQTVTLYWLPLVPERLRFLRPLVESATMHRLFAIAPPIGALLSHSFLLRGEGAAEVGGRS